MLRVGHIRFLNCFPVTWGLRAMGSLGDYDIVYGTPTELNRLLRDKELDISAISSIEYARMAKELVLLPGLSVSCFGPVGSIFLISHVPIDRLEGCKIALTDASATSQVMLKIILKKALHLNVTYIEKGSDLSTMLNEADAALLIGDKALYAGYQCPQALYLYDLGALWKEYAGMPMVFAVWAAREKSARDESQLISALNRQLKAAVAYSMDNLDRMAEEAAHRSNLDSDYMKAYYRKLRYDLTEDQRQGLIRYYQEAASIGAINHVPNLRFLEGNNHG